MATRVIDMSCPNCGAAVDTGQNSCKYCRQPIVISTFTSVKDMPLPLINQYANAYRQALTGDPDNCDLNTSIAMCYLKLKLYDQALKAFEKAVVDNFDNSETFFYAAICLLKGQKAFLAQRSMIDKIEEYLNAALMIEPRGIYYSFQAYIKFDYYSRKSFRTKPTYQEALAMAKQVGVSPFDYEQMYAIMNVSCPQALSIF